MVTTAVNVHIVKFLNIAVIILKFENNIAQYDKINKMASADSQDSDQPGHPPSLIRVFAVPTKKAWVLSRPLSA